MNDQTDVEAILDRFRDWLEQVRAGPEPQDDDDTAPDIEPMPREFGIINLVEEFTALRHELKLQTKSGRGLIEQIDNTVVALRQAIDQFRSVEPKEAQAVWSAAKPFAEALADLDEALVRGEREIDRARRQLADESVEQLETSVTGLFRKRSWIRRQFLRPFYREILDTVQRDRQARHELFDAFLEGYHLIQNRLRRAMASEQVEHVACEGKPVDPELMTVIELVDLPAAAPGTVAKELRRGYTWRGRLIRFAEVQAVRATPNFSADIPADSRPLKKDQANLEKASADVYSPVPDSMNGPMTPIATED